MGDRTQRACYMPRFWVVALGCMFTASMIFAGTSAFADEEKSGEVESRGMPQIQGRCSQG